MTLTLSEEEILAFRDIVGQPQAVRYLLNSIRNRRLAHAYLFAGGEGVGKTSCAISLVQAFNCEGGVEDGCGSCSACRKVMQFNSPDFTRIEPGGAARVIAISDIRRLRREIYLQPVEGKYKVFLLSCAERMNEESGNALLKVLEEPPEKSLLILSTSHPHLLLPTILSRCQVVAFRKLAPEEVAEVLRKKMDVGDAQAGFAANLSEGSPGRAMTLLRDGLDERERVMSWLGKNEANEVENILSMAEERTSKSGNSGAERRKKLIMFLDIVLSWYRDLLMIAAGSSRILNDDYAQELKRAACGLSIMKVHKALNLVLLSQRWIESNANPRLVLEVLFLEIRKLTAES
jgi:DNA polymerase-3 subunit delta'